jgi:hypothetical protein
MRRAGFLATLAAGVGLLGASLHGMTSVDNTLKIAAAPTPSPELLQERTPTGDRDCDRWKHRDGGGGREV